jgi:hypothetical protein
MLQSAAIYYPNSAIDIRDAAHQRLKTLRDFGLGERVFKARVSPTKDEELPCLCVVHGGERGAPDGDANVAAPKFIHSFTLRLSIIAAARSQYHLDGEIVTALENVKGLLLTDPTFLDYCEAVDRLDTTFRYPREAEPLLVEAILEMGLVYRSDWPPVAPNDLKLIVATTKLTPTADPLVEQFTIPTS